MRRRFFLLVSLTVLWLAGFAQRAAGPAPLQAFGDAPGELGSRLPEFLVRDLHGYRLSSSELRGKVVLIDFWATWCQPCKKEMPGYQRLLNKYRSRGFAVIGFKFDTMADTESPISFAKKLGVDYPLAVADDDLKNKFGGIEGLPTTMIYDRDGILRRKVVGFEYTDAFEAAVKPLL